MKTKKFFRPNFLLGIILAIGFLARVINVFWGLPVLPYINCFDVYTTCYHPDEMGYIRPALDLPDVYKQTSDWHRLEYESYGTTFPILTGTVLSPLRIFVNDPLIFKMSTIIFMRSISIAFGIVGIYSVYQLSLYLFHDKKAALVAAMLLAVNWIHVSLSAIAKPDVTMGTLLVLGFFLLFKSQEDNKLKKTVKTGFYVGLLLGTKITSFLFIPFALVYLFKKTNWKIKQYVKFLGIASIIYLFLNPQTVLSGASYFTSLKYSYAHWIERTTVAWYRIPRIWINATNNALGQVMLPLFFIGVLISIRKQKDKSLLLVGFIAGYYLFWRWLMSSKYMIPLLPILVMFLANGFMVFIQNSKKSIRVIGLISFLFYISWSFYKSALVFYAYGNDPRSSASKYISETLPKGASIGFSEVSEKLTWRWHSWRYPQISLMKYNLVPFINYPDYLIISSWDLVEIVPALKSFKLNKRTYVWDPSYLGDWYLFNAPEPSVFRFYDELLNCKIRCAYKEIKTFWLAENHIDTNALFIPKMIRIYKKNNL